MEHNPVRVVLGVLHTILPFVYSCVRARFRASVVFLSYIPDCPEHQQSSCFRKASSPLTSGEYALLYYFHAHSSLVLCVPPGRPNHVNFCPPPTACRCRCCCPNPPPPPTAALLAAVNTVAVVPPDARGALRATVLQQPFPAPGFPKGVPGERLRRARRGLGSGEVYTWYIHAIALALAMR